MKIIPVILSGGSGTRLWPLSRASFPKQLIALLSEKTMIQETVKRLDGLETSSPIVVCNEQHRFVIAEQLNQIGITDAKIILEPVARNTAAAITAACFQAKKIDDNSVVVVLPSDHSVKDIEVFKNAVTVAVEEASKGAIVTFGIKPTFAATGYGYIETELNLSSTMNISKIKRFVEKPNAVIAQKYLDSKNFFWNSGMFIFKASDLLKEIKEFIPEVYDYTFESFEKAQIDLDFIRLNKKSFEKNKNISIDYAVMEKTKNGMVIPLDAKWSDVGSWSSLWDICEKDDDGNVINSNVVVSDVKDSFIYSKNRTVAAIGLNDIVIVDTKDAILVADKAKSEDVKKIVNKLNLAKNKVAEENSIGYRPWGTFETIELGKRFRVKHIIVKPGQKLSVQMHYHRAEHWIIVSGTAKVRNGDKDILLSENQSTFIPLGTIHNIENPGKVPLEFIEVQSGIYLEEDDIVRLEDIYGRI